MDSTPNTTNDSGTSANTIVNDSAPADSNSRSSRNRRHRKRRNVPVRARSRMRSLQRYTVSRGSIGRRVAKGGGGTRNSSPSPAKREGGWGEGVPGCREKSALTRRCAQRSEEHTSELQSLMRSSYA